jgi:hypothetical protein
MDQHCQDQRKFAHPPSSFSGDLSADFWTELAKFLPPSSIYVLSRLSTALNALAWKYLIPIAGMKFKPILDNQQDVISKYLSRTPILSHLDLHFVRPRTTTVQWQILNCIRTKIVKLKSLWMTGPPIKVGRPNQLSWDFLDHLTDLESLNPNLHDINPSLEQVLLENLKNLKHFETYRSTHGQQLKHVLPHLTNLRSLKMYLPPFPQDFLDLISTLEKLEEIELWCDGLKEELTFPTSWTNMRSIKSWRCPKNITFFTNLQILDTNLSYQDHSETFQILTNLQTLRGEFTDARNLPTGTKYKPVSFKNLIHLTDLDLPHFNLISYQFLEAVCGIPNLKQLSLHEQTYNSTPNHRLLKTISKLTSLTTLKIYTQMLDSVNAKDGSGVLPSIGELTNLKTLALAVGFPSEESPFLSGLTNLEHLTLGCKGCHVDSVIQALSLATSLQTLRLPKTDLTREGLAVICQNFIQLRKLDCWDCKNLKELKRADIEPLREFKNLQSATVGVGGFGGNIFKFESKIPRNYFGPEFHEDQTEL